MKTLKHASNDELKAELASRVNKDKLEKMSEIRDNIIKQIADYNKIATSLVDNVNEYGETDDVRLALLTGSGGGGCSVDTSRDSYGWFPSSICG
jgi:mevalonate kinase